MYRVENSSSIVAQRLRETRDRPKDSKFSNFLMTRLNREMDSVAFKKAGDAERRALILEVVIECRVNSVGPRFLARSEIREFLRKSLPFMYRFRSVPWHYKSN